MTTISTLKPVLLSALPLVSAFRRGCFVTFRHDNLYSAQISNFQNIYD